MYIPPDARVSAVLELLADQITHTEQCYPDSFIIILGDFNQAYLAHELPKNRQHITCPARAYLTFNNDKPWFSAKLKQLRQAKEDAYRSGDKALYKQAKYTLNREIKEWQRKTTLKSWKNSFQVMTLHQCGKA